MRWLLASLLGITVVTVGGCGFYMQGRALGRAAGLRRVYIAYQTGYSVRRPHLLAALRRDLQARGVQVVGDKSQASAVLHVYSVGGPQYSVAVNKAGYSQRYEMVQQVRFALIRGGKPLVGPMSLSRRQDYVYTATTQLATDKERSRLERLLQDQLARDMVQRIDLLLHGRAAGHGTARAASAT